MQNLFFFTFNFMVSNHRLLKMDDVSSLPFWLSYCWCTCSTNQESQHQITNENHGGSGTNMIYDLFCSQPPGGDRDNLASVLASRHVVHVCIRFQPFLQFQIVTGSSSHTKAALPPLQVSLPGWFPPQCCAGNVTSTGVCGGWSHGRNPLCSGSKVVRKKRTRKNRKRFNF